MLHITISTEPRSWESNATVEGIRPHLVKVITAAGRVGLTVRINCKSPAGQVNDCIEWRSTWCRYRDLWSVDDWTHWFAQQTHTSAVPESDCGEDSGFQWRDATETGTEEWLQPQGHRS